MSFASRRLIMKSGDGIPAWNSMSLGVSKNLTRGAYGGTTFVLAGVESFETTNVLYSNNGTSWLQSTYNIGNVTGITYGADKFLSTAINTNAIFLSSDGINWTTASSPPSEVSWNDAAYGGGRFVIVRSGLIRYSTDGNTWTAASSPAINYKLVKYGFDRFVSITNNAITSSAYSADGTNWTGSTSLPQSPDWSAIEYGANKFVTIKTNSNIVAYSSNGITWTQSTLPSSQAWNSVAYGGGLFVAVASSTNRTAYSNDGVTWYEGNLLPVSGDWKGVIYGGNKFIAFQSGSAQAAYSIYP
jgi:hypothetical protein